MFLWISCNGEVRFGHEVIFFKNLDLGGVNFKTSSEFGPLDMRGVFTRNGLVYKVWNVENSRVETFLNAVKSGYFNNLTKIKYLIFDDDQNCRGYVIPEGKLIDIRLLSSRDEAFYKMNERNCYSAWYIKNNKFEKLLNELIIALDKFGYIFLDFSPVNLIELDGGCYIIDLDSVFFVDEIMELYKKKRGSFDFFLSCFPIEYKEAVSEYIKSK